MIKYFLLFIFFYVVYNIFKNIKISYKNKKDDSNIIDVDYEDVE